MRKSLALLTILLIAGLVAGCPRPSGPGGFKYTSADLTGGYRSLGGYLNDVAAGGEGGGGGDAPARELVEPDVIRQVGDTLFVLNQYRGLTLVDLESQTILDQVATLGFPRDLYVAGNRAYVLVAYAADFERHGDTVAYEIASRLYVVDISDPEDCAIVSTFGLEGDLTDSRLVGDVLYAVTAEYDWSWVDAIPLKAKTSASHIVSVNIADENNIFKADEVSTSNIGDVVYATTSAIFVAGWDFDKDGSEVTLIDISDPAGDLQVGDNVDVKGYIADKFKMDVYDGVLRIVSNGWADGRRTFITTVDVGDPNDLDTLAEIEFDRAHGETLFATRFDGTRGYIVTFFQVDPLFVVDFTDPANPVVAGELEVPGWSTHIEPRGNQLIALGVDNSNGNWQVSVSLFDVTDPANPALADRVSFGENWSWSSAYEDVKALTVLDDVIIVPFSGWEEVGGGFDRLQFVSWTPDDLTKRGTVDLQGSILRSFEHGDFYYGVTSEQLAQIDGSDLDHLEVTNTITLAENIADFVELSSSVGVEIVTQYDTGNTVARAVGLPLKGGLGEVEVNIGQLVGTHKRGDDVILVGASWYDEPGYKIAVVDFSDPSEPEVTGELDVDVWPYYGYWWILPYYEIGGGGGGGVVPAGGDAGVAVGGDVAVSSIWWPWFPSYRQKSTLLAGDTLVLRCTSESFDETLGDGAAYEGLALVDLDALELTTTVGLGFDAVSGVDAVGDKVYISSKTFIDGTVFPLNRAPECAYFITEFDPATVDAGPTVNVPGVFVQYNPGADILTLRDDEWGVNYEYNSLLRTVSWDGGLGVDEIDNTDLPDGASTVLGRGGKVYIEAFDNGVRLHVVDLSPGGAMQSGGDVLVTESWANLIDANGTSAYFGVGGGAIVRYDCSGDPDLEELIEVMGTPSAIRFGEAAAYAPLGYFGIVQLPL
ncbi:MAG: beta-propeller domain-containing protein [Candidatus Hydrogenedentes bacterium]|nr:beta-propeller domain-containing protein [Candidatus Hydrogenedentota bacterium]